MRKSPVALLLLAACSAPAAPPALSAAPRPDARGEGCVITGSPEHSGTFATCDPLGRWNAGGGAVEHWIYEPETKRRVTPGDVGRHLTLFRGNLPLPQFTWQPSDLQINQLLYPVERGFAAMYHVMNHGENPKDCRLFVGVAGDAVRPETIVSASAAGSGSREGDGGRPALAFDLRVEPGSSKFVFVTTPELQGQVPSDALDRAAEAWERRLRERRVNVPEPALLTSYVADRAGSILGIASCAEGVAKLEARLVKVEGDVVRLLPDVPEAWRTELIEAVGVPTPHGPVSFKHDGAFNTPSWDLGEGCRPPGGFLLPIPGTLRITIDGRRAEAKDGWLKVPAGSKRVETVR